MDYQARRAPGPRGGLLVGSLAQFRRDPLRFYLNVQREFGDVARFRWATWTVHLISHPDDIRYIFQTNDQNYRKGVFFEMLKPMLGQGLLTAEGEAWLRKRRAMQPAFHRQKLNEFVSVMTEATGSMVERWHTYADGQQVIDVAKEMWRLTLQIVGRSFLGTNIGSAADEIGRAFSVLIDRVYYRATHVFVPPESFPTPQNRRFLEARRVLDEAVIGMIEARRKQNGANHDLLSFLMDARDVETGRALTAQELRDQILTILFAGHETTASALAWTWYLLTQNPSVERRLREEAFEVLSGRSPTVDDLSNLTYTKMVVQEGLRLYPPVWAIPRTTIEADEIRGYRIPKRSHVVACQYVTHRHAEFWREPERFDPSRFSPDEDAGRPRFAYFPFGVGPRHCLGEHFAMTEMLVVIAMVVQVYRLRLSPDFRVQPEAAVTLRPHPGVRVNIHRSNARAETCNE